jgi:hypothetical protein
MWLTGFYTDRLKPRRLNHSTLLLKTTSDLNPSCCLQADQEFCGVTGCFGLISKKPWLSRLLGCELPYPQIASRSLLARR